jgi:hypothetical protein
VKLLVALSLAAWPLAAHGLWPDPGRDPRLIIDVTVPGRVRAWLSMAEPVPESAAQRLAEAMGCLPTDVSTQPPRIVYVECAVPLHKDGPRWSGHWDLDPLNALLRGYGAEAIDFYFYHPRSGFSVLRPTEIPRYRWAGYNVVYLGKLRLAFLHDIHLEAGLTKQQTWVMAAAAGAILLLPLLLFPARAAGKLPAMAGANALFWLAVNRVALCNAPPERAGLGAAALESRHRVRAHAGCGLDGLAHRRRPVAPRALLEWRPGCRTPYPDRRPLRPDPIRTLAGVLRRCNRG